MLCPKCEEGDITKIVFKKNKQYASLCEFCGTVWFNDELIHEATGHSIQSVTGDGGIDYTFEDVDKDDEQKSITLPKYK